MATQPKMFYVRGEQLFFLGGYFEKAAFGGGLFLLMGVKVCLSL